MAELKTREVKVVLLGDSGVGKSSLCLRFVTNNFKPFNESTIGASFMSKVIMSNGKQIKYQIWDTAGQEKYHSLAPMYYRGAAAGIVVYDVTRASSFRTLKQWVEELQEHGPRDIIIAIAGNKADMSDKREVDYATAEAYAQSIGASYTETSAKEDLHVQKLFMQISEKLPEPRADAPAVRPISRQIHTNGSTSRSSASRDDGGSGCC